MMNLNRLKLDKDAVISLIKSAEHIRQGKVELPDKRELQRLKGELYGFKIDPIKRKYKSDSVPKRYELNEFYREVKGFPGYYISNFGNLRVATQFKRRNNKLIIVNRNQVMRKNKSGTRYLYTKIYNSDGEKQVTYHSLVANAFLFKTRGKTQVNHIDHTRNNNDLFNLEWVTRTENRIKSVEFYKNNKECV